MCKPFVTSTLAPAVHFLAWLQPERTPPTPSCTSTTTTTTIFRCWSANSLRRKPRGGGGLTAALLRVSRRHPKGQHRLTHDPARLPTATHYNPNAYTLRSADPT